MNYSPVFIHSYALCSLARFNLEASLFLRYDTKERSEWRAANIELYGPFLPSILYLQIHIAFGCKSTSAGNTFS